MVGKGRGLRNVPGRGMVAEGDGERQLGNELGECEAVRISRKEVICDGMMR